jgi:excisionase family DNA binding protein
MTLIEAAGLLGVTPDNLRGAIKRGALKAVKHGRDWWVSPAEVERYRLNHRRGVRVTYRGEDISEKVTHHKVTKG